MHKRKKCVEEIGFKESIRLTLFSLLSLCVLFSSSVLFSYWMVCLCGLTFQSMFSSMWLSVRCMFVFFVYRMSLKCHSFIMSIMSLLIVIAHPEV